jgi:hypothetical protein
MKKSLLLICIALCIASCQSESGSVNPVNKWVKMTSYPFKNANNAAVVQGTLVITDSASTAVFFTGKLDGSSWTATSASFGPVTSLISYGGGVYCVAQGSGVNYSSDLCQSWVQKNNGLPNNNAISNLVATDIGLFVCGNGLYYSNDKGDNWKDISIQGTTSVLSVVYLDHTLIASTNKGLYNSMDNGASWALLYSSSGISNASITTFGVFDNGIYAASSIVANSTVYASYDKGNSWIVSSGLDILGANSFNAFEYHNGTLYVASKHGVFESIDNARHWVFSGCDNALSFVKVNNVLFAGTASNGLWSTVLQESY